MTPLQGPPKSPPNLPPPTSHPQPSPPQPSPPPPPRNLPLPKWSGFRFLCVGCKSGGQPLTNLTEHPSTYRWKVGKIPSPFCPLSVGCSVHITDGGGGGGGTATGTYFRRWLDGLGCVKNRYPHGTNFSAGFFPLQEPKNQNQRLCSSAVPTRRRGRTYLRPKGPKTRTAPPIPPRRAWRWPGNENSKLDEHRCPFRGNRWV